MKGKWWPSEHRLVMRLGQRFHDPIRLFFGEIVPADEQVGDRDTAHVGRDPGIRALGDRRAAVDGSVLGLDSRHRLVVLEECDGNPWRPGQLPQRVVGDQVVPGDGAEPSLPARRPRAGGAGAIVLPRRSETSSISLTTKISRLFLYTCHCRYGV